MGRRKSSNLTNSSGRKKHCGDVDDRISNLPDSILGNILSLLPTKNAVATEILSKRWKLLWTATVNIDFCCPNNYTGSVERFVQFVNSVLLLHKPGYLNRFSLTWDTGCIPLYVNIWIRAAAIRNVLELIVSCRISELPIQVHESMFSCEMLQILELKCSICISDEIAVSLPRLESLKLISVYFRSENALSKLIGGCPVLKNLVIEMNIGKMIVHGSEFKCMISSDSLKHLDLYVYGKYTSPLPHKLCSVELDAPSLLYISFKGQIHRIFMRQKSLAFLGTAYIDLSDLNSRESNICNSFVEAVGAFGCAKTLTVHDQVIRALSCATIKLKTTFNRLTRLVVSIDWNYCSALQDLIQLSDHLERLILFKGVGYYVNRMNFNNSNWKKPNLVPRCLSNTLREVFIDAYDGYPDELAMVRYILKHGSVIKCMDIYFGKSSNDFERKYEVVQNISSFSRKSPNCKVNFH